MTRFLKALQCTAVVVCLTAAAGTGKIILNAQSYLRSACDARSLAVVRTEYKDVCSKTLTNSSTEVGKYWLSALSGTHAPADRPQTTSQCSVACAPLLQRRVFLWIGGPPASGKTTLARRMHDYGFTVGDCESVEGNFTKFSELNEIAFQHGTSSFVFAACYSEYLESAPSGVFRVLILPKKETALRRMRERDPMDQQDLDYFHAQARQTSKSEKVLTIVPHDRECVDQTVIRVCDAVSTSLHTHFSGDRR